MKKTLLFCLGLILALVGYVHAAPPANATFTAERGLVFQLVFDGRALTQRGARQIHLDRLAPGYHWAEFFIPVGYGRSINYRTQVFLDGGLESNFVLITRPSYPPVLRKVSAFPIGRGSYGPGVGGPRGSYPSPAPQGPGYGNGYPDPNDYEHEPVYSAPNVSGFYLLAPQEVDGLFEAVRRQPFDDDKLALVRSALREASIPADDARRIVSTIAFDRNRIELAKYVYSHVADRQNFYRVYDALQFQSSIREVQQYVDSYRP